MVNKTQIFKKKILLSLLKRQKQLDNNFFKPWNFSRTILHGEILESMKNLLFKFRSKI